VPGERLWKLPLGGQKPFHSHDYRNIQQSLFVKL
jgi:hypothetical protein